MGITRSRRGGGSRGGALPLKMCAGILCRIDPLFWSRKIYRHSFIFTTSAEPTRTFRGWVPPPPGRSSGHTRGVGMHHLKTFVEVFPTPDPFWQTLACFRLLKSSRTRAANRHNSDRGGGGRTNVLSPLGQGEIVRQEMYLLMPTVLRPSHIFPSPLYAINPGGGTRLIFVRRCANAVSETITFLLNFFFENGTLSLAIFTIYMYM